MGIMGINGHRPPRTRHTRWQKLAIVWVIAPLMRRYPAYRAALADGYEAKAARLHGPDAAFDNAAPAETAAAADAASGAVAGGR